MDFNNFKKLSEVLRAHLLQAVARKAAREAYLYRIIDNFQRRSDIERPTKFQPFVDFARTHSTVFKYQPNRIDDTARKEVGRKCDDAKRGSAPEFLPMLLFYEREHDRAAFDSILQDARDELGYVTYFLNGVDGRRAATKKGLMRQVDVKARVGMKLIDWEVANRRVNAAHRAAAQRLSVSRLLIDSLPEQGLYLQSLEQLNIHSTLITTLKPFSQLKNISLLDASYNMIDSLDGLNVSRLEILYCGVTNISKLEVLKNAKNLKRLHCGSSYVSDLTPLADCLNLELLFCDDTNVSSLDGLQACSRLATIDISDTYVSDLNPICGLSKLKEIVLNGCHIDASLQLLCSLPALNSIIFFQGSAEGVPVDTLSRESYENCLPRLKEFYRQRGKERQPVSLHCD